MKRSNEIVTAVVAIVVCLAGMLLLQQRAPDFWRKSKSVTERGVESPIFLVDVSGVGRNPTVAYIVRCADRTTLPTNFLDLCHTVNPQVEERSRVVDHLRSECLLLVGRRVGETIQVQIDPATAQKWFRAPEVALADVASCQRLWEELVTPRLTEYDRTQPTPSGRSGH
jgi:hypothetical protein